MAVPKQRTSTQRKGKRRAGQPGVKATQLVKCKNCDELKTPHTICKSCGTYRGREYK
ncbi:50S ribosomal protein L32 [Candidatus Roizmanbacteria bacterium CG22_combo_CG10-13_8_21_14_all_38_20]|uniref:Large ribosomal subunit protein bL32 n=1 Tax=Candidatus Roizmanbacteria bacterium CG22_combo_CG10-13_8_21_14_all_38_20 TaxID=1974862 RepID=A0A2H0BV93_9BACT|nr:50S ribosomal protein L32 [Candidatus Microgenomates bacterium]PIP61597.1 MAG: 50S ribosomal protein L32 [Candidatus Roizmanbacteria bacterium CG22_combo_CG10-13_8_21_14_all_38_20]PJC30580.1 MAG: 50S ribosomal protein L32 [Candidatus Roizmanbacteria bacterium CG_4_9_14_0_2_um_filter_38_17]